MSNQTIADSDPCTSLFNENSEVRLLFENSSGGSMIIKPSYTLSIFEQDNNMSLNPQDCVRLDRLDQNHDRGGVLIYVREDKVDC